jgi:ATP-dependent Clp protease protease subunit
MALVNIPVPKERNLYLAQQVNQLSINDLSKSIININDDDEYLKKLYLLNGLTYKPDPIKIFIDSYGGSAYQCFGLLGIINNSKTPIHTIVTGCAMSCGFIISIAGHKRFCYSTSTFLYHQVQSFQMGPLKEIEDGIKESKRLQKLAENHVIRYTKITKRKLNSVYHSKHDWFITPKSALKLKIVDKVLN